MLFRVFGTLHSRLLTHQASVVPCKDRYPHKCPQWLTQWAFTKPAHVMGFGIGSVALGLYLGTLGGMIVKYYRVKKFFADNVHSQSDQNANEWE